MQVNSTIVMFLPLLLSSLLHITTCTIYTVTSDDYMNSTCHNCHNLRYYLLGNTRYFTSYTQLLFLQGRHHLHTSLIISNVHNISLIGSTADERNKASLQTVISCYSEKYGIEIVNSTNVIFKNKKFACEYSDVLSHGPFILPSALVILNCHNVYIHKLSVKSMYSPVVHMSNVFGDSTISNLISNGLQITYLDTSTAKSAKLEVYNYRDFTNVRKGDTARSLIIALGQNHYGVIVNITNTNFQHNMLLFIESKSCGNYINMIFINNCTFKNNRNLEIFNSLIDIHLFFCKNKNTGIVQVGSTTVLIQYSLFYNNKVEKSTNTPLINCAWLSAVDFSHNFSGTSNATLIVNNSSFNKNECANILYLFTVSKYSLGLPNSIYIIDTTFSCNTQNYQYPQFSKRVSIVHSKLGEVYLIGTVVFINNT